MMASTPKHNARKGVFLFHTIHIQFHKRMLIFDFEQDLINVK